MYTDPKTPLSPLQLELLKAFAMPTIDDADLLEIRKMLSQYFAKKASIQAQRIVEDNRYIASNNPGLNWSQPVDNTGLAG